MYFVFIVPLVIHLIYACALYSYIQIPGGVASLVYRLYVKLQTVVYLITLNESRNVITVALHRLSHFRQRLRLPFSLGASVIFLIKYEPNAKVRVLLWLFPQWAGFIMQGE